uniref:Uncharacterized protein n=1 Tax=Anguilla anguilla TaxID=7936 RepID=A0A0E9XBB7_ANGAN
MNSSIKPHKERAQLEQTHPAHRNPAPHLSGKITFIKLYYNCCSPVTICNGRSRTNTIKYILGAGQ